MNNGSWDIGLWLRKIINDATEHIVSWVKTVEMRVNALITQESTNSQKIKEELQESTEEILTAVESIQNLFKSAAEATLEPSQALEGEKFWNGTVLKTGTMPNKAGITVQTSGITQDDENIYAGISAEGFYDESSKVSIPQSDLTNVYDLGTGTSFDVSDIPGYQNLTADNFIVCSASCSGSASENHSCSATAAHGKKYNANTGILSITGGSASASDSGSVTTCRLSLTLSAPQVYLVKGKINR